MIETHGHTKSTSRRETCLSWYQLLYLLFRAAPRFFLSRASYFWARHRGAISAGDKRAHTSRATGTPLSAWAQRCGNDVSRLSPWYGAHKPWADHLGGIGQSSRHQSRPPNRIAWCNSYFDGTWAALWCVRHEWSENERNRLLANALSQLNRVTIKEFKSKNS